MKIGLIQLQSSLEYSENLEKIAKLLEQAQRENVKAVFLPECFYSMSDGTEPSPYLVSPGNEHYQNIKQLAMDFKIALLGGTAASLINNEIINRAYNFDEMGNELNHYDKVHLFACDIQKGESKKVINEADIYKAGNDYSIVEYKDLKIGQGICFDIRFSEQAHYYRNQNCNILTFPAAFTVPTGKAHWHILNRARAIENQCFVISAAQWGRHNDKIQTYGHSIVVDPWGEVLVDAQEGEKLVVTELDLSKVDKIRKNVLMNR